MNTDKIRAALKVAIADGRADGLTQKWAAEALAELDKVQQDADPVLMDYQPFSLEESNAKEGYYTKIVTRGGVICMILQPNPSNFTYGRKFGDAVVQALNASIPNVQQPGKVLTVDDWEQLVKEWCFGWCERVAPDDSDWSDLRARLTAAIEAKAAKQ